MTQSVACCLLELNLVQLFHSYLMSDVDQRSQQVVYISETSSLWTIVPWLDPTVYCHTDLDQLLCFSLKNSVKHTKHAGLDRWPCIITCQLFPAAFLHPTWVGDGTEWNHDIALPCLSTSQANITLVDSNNRSSNRNDTSLDGHPPLLLLLQVPEMDI